MTEKYSNDIYPKELDLKHENCNDSKGASYPDLKLEDTDKGKQYIIC